MREEAQEVPNFIQGKENYFSPLQYAEKKMKASLIRLFRCVEIEVEKQQKATSKILELTLKKGFVFSPEVIYNYSEANLVTLVNEIETEIGLTPEELNNSFHKSWRKISDTSIEQLVLEQLVHYFTTYGFEKLDIYHPESVYIPREKLEIPELNEDLNVVVINGYTKFQIKEKLITLLQSGIALHEDTIKDVVSVCKYVDLGAEHINEIKNKEVRTALFNDLQIIPHNPVEFLRYLIFQATEKTLLIKDKETLEAIKISTNLDNIYQLLTEYKNKYGLAKLAEIFLRYKPIFLAFKSHQKIKPIVNKIRKLAVKHHKPLAKDYLNEITAMIKHGIAIDELELNRHLEKVNNFRKIRLAYALKYRIKKDVSSILYKIRNGKGFASVFDFPHHGEAKRILDIVIKSLVKDIQKNVEGKKIYIPHNVTYALPATEKNFTGMLPSGSYINIPKNMIVGINWHNVNKQHIDLDLSLISASEKFGWDENYRNEDSSILFSGDMTDAHGKNGATELFYVQKQLEQAFILYLNYFNYDPNIEVPFKLIVAQKKLKDLRKNYMVNPNHVIAIANSKIKVRQKILGLLITTPEECRFYFAETSIGKSITSSNDDLSKYSRKYLMNNYQDTISLNDLLTQAGAEIVDNINNCDLNLSLETIEKDTIINLLTDVTPK